MRIGVLNNLRAGRSGPRVTKLLNFLRQHPEVLHVETDSAHALPEALSDLARREVDLLVVNGGDGTLQHALTELLTSDEWERLPLVAPLRGGRTNMTAMDLHAHRTPVKGLAEVIDAAAKGTIANRTIERPVLRVKRGLRDVHYGMFFGAGMIHRAISLTHRIFPTGRSQGTFGASLVTASLVARTAFRPKDGVLRPDKIQILLDDEMVPFGEFYLVISTSLQRLFMRMNPFWGTGPGGIRFTCISTSAPKFGRMAPGVLMGRPGFLATAENGYTSRNAEHAVLSLDCGYTIDGEVFEGAANETVTLAADRRIKFVRA